MTCRKPRTPPRALTDRFPDLLFRAAKRTICVLKNRKFHLPPLFLSVSRLTNPLPSFVWHREFYTDESGRFGDWNASSLDHRGEQGRKEETPLE